MNCAIQVSELRKSYGGYIAILFLRDLIFKSKKEKYFLCLA